MKKITFVLFLITGTLFSQNELKTISGRVTDGKNPLNNVKITLNDLDNGQTTNADGYYSLQAKVGDVINYAYPGMKTVEIKVEDVTRILNLTMFPDIEELDEVVVTKSKRRSQSELELEYQTNKKLIRTAYGILDPETSAFQIRSLPESSITTVNLCVLDLLRAEFPGVRVVGDCINGGSISVRGSSSLENDKMAIYDLDGQIFRDAPIWIPTANIKRMAVLSSLAATIKYGAIASGGVVIINTRSGSGYSKEIWDKAKLRNNNYMGDAVSVRSLLKDAPTYLQEMHASTSLEEAKKVYGFYAPRYGASYSYFVDAFQYFAENWNDSEIEDAIVHDGLVNFNDNPLALKAFAYAQQAKGNYELANEFYKDVFILRPNYGQSYMDLANSYREIGETKKAAAMYARHDYLRNEGFMHNDSTPFATLMDRELNNLIALKGRDILSKQDFKKVLLEEDFNGTRLVFEWNDSEAEFVLQFVNPENRFLKTEHSLEANPARIMQEKRVGYSCEEFLIDESLPGTWQINATYLGNKRLTPTYLKATIYYGYGSPTQRKVVKMFRLGLKNVNQRLFTISNDVVGLSN